MYYENEIKPPIIKCEIYRKLTKINNQISKEIMFYNIMKKHLNLFNIFIKYQIIADNMVILTFKKATNPNPNLNPLNKDCQKNYIINLINKHGFYNSNYDFIIDEKNNYKLCLWSDISKTNYLDTSISSSNPISDKFSVDDDDESELNISGI